MDRYQDELAKVKKLLLEHPEGLSIGAISQEIAVNRNSVAKYLDVLQISGCVELRRVGPAKLFYLAHRVPMDALIDFADDIIVICDSDKTIMKLNHTAEDFFGKKVLNTSLDNLIPKLPNKKKFETEIEGKLVLFKYLETTFEDGSKGITLVGEDITQEKQMRQRLRLLERAVESSSSGITIADATKQDLPLIYVNAGFEKITGYKSKEVLGKNCRFLQKEDRDQTGLTELRTAFRKQRDCVVEVRNYTKNGKKFWNELRISPIKDDSGTVTHYIGVQTDITHKRK